MTKWDDNWRDQSFREQWLTPAPDVVDLVATMQKLGVETVLDLGCGVGRHAHLLAALGFEVERFGSGSLKVASVPAGLDGGAVEAVVRDLLAAAELVEPGQELAHRLDAAVKRAACAAAVKARARLEPSEVMALLNDLEGLRNPTHCPHGRPLLCRLPRGEIEARFHRK